MDTSHFAVQLRSWIDTVSSNLPALSGPEAKTAAAWSLAAAVEKNCSLTKAALFLGALLGESANTARQRLRELYLPADRKRGASRRAFRVEGCFAALLGWVLRLWPVERLPLALDASLCRDRLAALVISVPLRRGAVPVAWAMREANTEGAWMPLAIDLLGRLAEAVPEGTEVLVMADRGLYSKDLFEAIAAEAGWHPLLRMTRLGTFRPYRPDGKGPNPWRSLGRVLPFAGLSYCERVDLFKTPSKRLRCTLLAGWAKGCDEPWILITDLPPRVCQTGWYGVRSWIEQGFRMVKSLGLDWEHTRITDPKRSRRRWLVVALACLHAQVLGARAEDLGPRKARAIVPLNLELYDVRTAGGARKMRPFQLGVLWIKVALLRHDPLPQLKPIEVDPLPLLDNLKPVRPVLPGPL